MPETHQETLTRYLQSARAALLWKLEGLSEYDVRRPITPTGTNLLGLVKHVASVELGYFVGCFGRELPIEMPWYDDDAEENQDMWATPEESREDFPTKNAEQACPLGRGRRGSLEGIVQLVETLLEEGRLLRHRGQRGDHGSAYSSLPQPSGQATEDRRIECDALVAFFEQTHRVGTSKGGRTLEGQSRGRERLADGPNSEHPM